MTDDELLDYLIIVLYDAILQPHRWREAVQICGYVAENIESSTFMIDNINHTLINSVVADMEFSDQIIKEYTNFYINYDQIYADTRVNDFCYAFHQSPHGIDHNKFYQAFFINHGTPLLLKTWQDSKLNLHMDLLKNHLKRVLDIQKTHYTLSTQVKINTLAIDALKIPILIVDWQAKIVHLNNEATQTLQLIDSCLSNLGVFLSTTDHNDKKNLDELLLAATSADKASGAMTLNTLDAWQVYVTPLPAQALNIPELESNLAMVLILKPEKTHSQTRLDLFAKFYNFSAAEIKVASAILLGKSPDDYAQEAGVSMNTVRTHIKNLLNKTDTHRQTEFVALLNQLPLIKD